MKIAVASGKGGTGKTFLSTNLFAVMKQSGCRVVLTDCDADVPNASIFLKGETLQTWTTKTLCPKIDLSACTFCALCADNCSYNAINCVPSAKYIKVEPEFCHGCGACLVECPHHAVTEAWKTIGTVTAYGTDNCPQLFEARIREGERSSVPVLREAIRRSEETDAEYLILDAPPGCSCPFVNTIMDADMVILVTEPTPFGLSDLKHTVEVLRRLNKPFRVVINRADLGDGQMKEWLANGQIELLAEIPYSENIATLYAKGELTVEREPEIKQLFTNLMKRITKHEDSHS